MSKMSWGERRFIFRMVALAIVVIGGIAWYAWGEWYAAVQADPLMVGGTTFAIVAAVTGSAVAWGHHEKKRQLAWAKAQEDDSDNRTV
ncbi:MAG: hypothetical protein GY913_29605 [Proteobacteria bacterium]|nr:hypothetical protein [Pseudomonadota bacterium]